MSQYKTRFKDAPWFSGSVDEKIIIGGAGGIGSNTAYSLAKSTQAQIYVVDFDSIEEHNIGTQFFNVDSIGESKVTGLTKTLSYFGIHNIIPLFSKIGSQALPISISAFDNMEARKEMFENWKKLEGKELFVDGRLRANLYEVYVVTPDRIKQYEDTLFDDSSGLGGDGVCTFKQSAYLAVMIGARIAHVVLNYLSNKYSGEDLTELPFMIQEVTEPFFIKVE